jgi:hypothetical protein
MTAFNPTYASAIGFQNELTGCSQLRPPLPLHVDHQSLAVEEPRVE